MNDKLSLVATAREHLKRAHDAASGRSADSIVGGHTKSLRQTVVALVAGRSLDGTRSRRGHAAGAQRQGASRRRQRLLGGVRRRPAGDPHRYGTRCTRWRTAPSCSPSSDPAEPPTRLTGPGGAARAGGDPGRCACLVVPSRYERAPGDGDRDRVRHLRPRPPARERDAQQQPGRQRVRARGARGRAGAMRWDYEEETPLRDARGFDLTRDGGRPQPAHRRGPGPGQPDPHQRRPALRRPRPPGVLQPRGHQPARRRALGQGRRARHGARGLARTAPAGRARGRLYKNNTDNKGASYGTHENYLMRRSTPFADIVRAPHAVLRHPSGHHRRRARRDRPGRPRHGLPAVSQRADYFEVEVGLETTLKRPIINTRDEPHADPEKYRRLHVIVGDANLSEISTYLKLGTTALVLAMIEDGFLDLDLPLSHPVRELHAVSHDRVAGAPGHDRVDGRRSPRSSCSCELPRAGPQVRRGPARRRRRRADRRRARALGVASWTGSSRPDEPARRARLGRQALAARGYRERDGVDWDDARLHLVDLQYADVRPDEGPVPPAACARRPMRAAGHRRAR